MKPTTISTAKRHLANMLAGLSLLLCLAIAALWVRSYWVQDGIGWNTQQRGNRLCCSCGLLRAAIDLNGAQVTSPFGMTYPPGMNRNAQKTVDLPADLADDVANSGLRQAPVRIYYWHGFGFYRYDSIDGIAETDILLPLWVFLVLLLVLPVSRIVAHRRRATPGYCRKCGYDLRATPDRCPECGQMDEHRNNSTGRL